MRKITHAVFAVTELLFRCRLVGAGTLASAARFADNRHD
jgi:hypothetical protein